MRPGPTALRLSAHQLDEMVAHCLRCYPEEGCGLLSGEASTGTVRAVHPMANAAASAGVYALDPREHLRVDLLAETAGSSIIGVFHSHTHTDPYPSPTDVRQAPDPGWHYVLVSLRHELVSTRSYRIVGGNISEEAMVVLGQ
ncbi:MAG: M67 family metallopeptidase [Actinomycetota bacterium]|nr:M67 family metallopeptidase [Actinomycetota bacterium]